MQLSIFSQHHRRLVLCVMSLFRVLVSSFLTPVAYGAAGGSEQQSANFGLVALVAAIGTITIAGIVGGLKYGRRSRGYEGTPRGPNMKHSRSSRVNLPKARDHTRRKRLRGYR